MNVLSPTSEAVLRSFILGFGFVRSLQHSEVKDRLEEKMAALKMELVSH